eukprot:scaffold249658_cov19-Tisochrysis_lutea.AAC.1
MREEACRQQAAPRRAPGPGTPRSSAPTPPSRLAWLGCLAGPAPTATSPRPPLSPLHYSRHCRK